MPSLPPVKVAGLDLGTGKDLIARRHAEWRERQARWQWLLDSLEGGDAYRRANYGSDGRGWPLRNLIRHPREYPAPEAGHRPRMIPDSEARTFAWSSHDGRAAGGEEPSGDDYWLRWTRTPPPTFVAEAVDFQLSRIFSREPRREGPQAYLDWLDDVDGAGTSAKRWVREELAPRLFALGCLDVLADRPPLPDGAPYPETRADIAALGLDRVEVRLIEPGDVLDWGLDRRRQYTWVLNREYHEVNEPAGTAFVRRYRLWDRASWWLYDAEGEMIGAGIHGLGMVPQIRLFTRRAPRSTHVGVSLFEATAELQREYYNRDSELILDDTTQAHPQLQGDASAIEDGTITIGPGWVLPVKNDHNGHSIPWSVIDFPKGASESIRRNKSDLRDAADRLNGLAKPAGANGSGTVGQSGISKSFDDRRANDLLVRRSTILADEETKLGRLVVAVAADGKPDPADLNAVMVSYSQRFDLLDAETMGARWAEAAEALSAARKLGTIEAGMKLYGAMLRELLPGLADAEYAGLENEGRRYLEAVAAGEGEGAGEDAEENDDLPDFDPDDPDAYPDPDDPDDFDDEDDA